MKCGEVQFLLWNGTMSDLIESHLQTCPDCQKEHAAMQQIFQKVHAIETPTPTRSLKPSMEVISQAVDANRKRRSRRYSLMAASITVLLGAGSGLVMHYNSALNGQPQQNTTQAERNPVPVQVAPSAANQEILQAIAKDLSIFLKATDVKNIVVTGFTPDDLIDPTNTSVVGEFTFTADLQPGAKTNLVAGVNKSLVTLHKVDGQWSVSLIEATVTPKTPQEAADLWSKANMGRNGILEYSLLSPELKAKARKSFEQHHWVINGSSPQVKGSQVTKLEQQTDGTYLLSVKMDLGDSAGSMGQQSVTLTLKKYGENWYIEKREYTDISFNAVDSSLQLPDGGKKLYSAGPSANSGTWGDYTVSLKTLGYEAQDDDLQVLARSGGMILHSEQVQLFGGTGKLLLMQNSAGKQEYWLVVDRPQQLQANLNLAYVMILSSSKQNDTATKQAILDLAKSWTVPNE